MATSMTCFRRSLAVARRRFVPAGRRSIVAAALSGSSVLNPCRAAAAPADSVARRALEADSGNASAYSAPFDVGEQLRYTVKFGIIKAGEGYVEVLGRDTVRGREA
jgi:hypothetical protein